MKVEQTVLLEEGTKKVTQFLIVPHVGLEQTAIKMVHEAAFFYVVNAKVLHQKYIAPDNPFVVLIIEGINS